MLPRKLLGGIGISGVLIVFALSGMLRVEMAQGQEEVYPPFPHPRRAGFAAPAKPTASPTEHRPFDPQLNALGGSRLAEAQLQQRINSLKIAARTLSASGFEREATDLTRKAASLEKELQQLQVPAPGGDHSGLAVEIHQLRHSIDGLRQEISLLRHELKHLAADPSETAERMKKTRTNWNVSPEGQEAVPPVRPDLDEIDDGPDSQAKMLVPGVRQASPATPKSPVEFELVPVPNLPEDEPVPTPSPVLTPEQVTEETSKR